MSTLLRRVADRKGLVLGGVLAMAGAAVAVVGPANDHPSTTAMRASASADAGALDRMPSIAVLPFTTGAANENSEYLGHGVAAELVAALANVGGVRVASWKSSFAVTGADLATPEIARGLNVTSLLEGTTDRDGGQIRITARLTEADGGTELWSNSYTVVPAGIVDVPEEIARDIVAALRGHPVDDSVRITDPPTNDIGAYDAYLQGQYLLHRGTRESLLAARDAFRRAIQLDPAFARAHTGLADAYAALVVRNHVPPHVAFPAAKAAARAALEVDPDLARAHAVLGYAALYYDWDWPVAERELRTAIGLDPSDAQPRQWLADYLAAMGRLEDAMRSMRVAVDLEPLSATTSVALGRVHHFSGNDEAALDQYRRTLELDANLPLAHLWNGISLLEDDRPRAALRSVRRALQLSPEEPLVIATLALAQARAGEHEDAARLLEWLRAREDRHHTPSYEIAKAHLAMGDASQALEWLERALDERSPSMVFLAVDPHLDPLRGDPAFADLVSRMGLDAAASGYRKDPARR